MPQFFVRKNAIKDGWATLEGEEAHHARAVCRLKVGDPIRVFDGEGRGLEGRIEGVSRRTVGVKISVEHHEPDGHGINVVLGQSLVPRDAMDWIVEKATELGAGEIIPVVSERSIVKLGAVKRSSKRSHWQRLALSACKQCGRLILPKIHEVTPLRELARGAEHYDLVLLTDPDGDAFSIEEYSRLVREAKNILAIVGPEGGYSKGEVKEWTDRGAKRVSLGLKTLRSETAALYVLGILRFLSEAG